MMTYHVAQVWAVIGPNGTRMIFKDRDETERMATLLNMAYETGRRAVLPCSNAPSRVPKSMFDIENDEAKVV